MRLKPSHPRLRQGHPLTNGLIGAWVMNEGGGSQVANSASGRWDGSFVSTTGDQWRGGLAGASTRVTEGYINTGLTSLESHTELTVATRFLVFALPGWSSSRRGICNKYDPSASNRAFLLNVGHNATSAWAKIDWTVQPVGSTFNAAFSLSGTQDLEANRWYSLVATFKAGSHMRIFIDGNLDAQLLSPPSQVANNTQPFRISATQNTTLPLNGLMDHLYLLNRDMPADEVSGHFADPFAAFRPRQRSYFALAGSAPAGTTVTPATATLTLATFAPTVTATANQTATPSTASLTLATFTPTVTAANNITVTPGIASLAITAYAATVAATANQTVVPGVASLTLTAFAPEITAADAVTVTPTTASLNITSFAPTVTAITPPTDVVATALSSSSIGLSWTHPGGAVTFELQRRIKVGA